MAHLEVGMVLGLGPKHNGVLLNAGFIKKKKNLSNLNESKL